MDSPQSLKTSSKLSIWLVLMDGVSAAEVPRLELVRCTSTPWTVRVGVNTSSGLGRLSL